MAIGSVQFRASSHPHIALIGYLARKEGVPPERVEQCLNKDLIRTMVCERLDWCGLSLDRERNRQLVDAEGRITSDNSRLHAYVIPSEEELMIAHEAVKCVQQEPE